MGTLDCISYIILRPFFLSHDMNSYCLSSFSLDDVLKLNSGFIEGKELLNLFDIGVQKELSLGY